MSRVILTGYYHQNEIVLSLFINKIEDYDLFPRSFKFFKRFFNFPSVDARYLLGWSNNRIAELFIEESVKLLAEK